MLLRSHSIIRRRKGSAPVEFLMSLPLLMTLLVGMIVGTVVVFRIYDVMLKTRYAAWTAAAAAGPHTTIPLSFDSDFGRLAGAASGSGFYAYGESRYQSLPRFFGIRGVTLTARNGLMAGTWDHRSNRFVDRESLQVADHFDVHDDDGKGRLSLQALADAVEGKGD